MSANIPSTMPMSDLLKSTGYNCPEELQGKTFDEATSGGDAKISTNTAATVDVSQYTEPVEIEPAEGYDATKKVTLTLTNIPSGSTPAPYVFSLDDFPNIYMPEIVCMGTADIVSVADDESHVYPATDLFIKSDAIFSAGGYSLIRDFEFSTAYYQRVTPVGNENPQESHWYEYINGEMEMTTDQTVDASKTYYVRLSGITSVTFQNNGHNYTISVSASNWTGGSLTPDA